jgi:hypothetical protein
MSSKIVTRVPGAPHFRREGSVTTGTVKNPACRARSRRLELHPHAELRQTAVGTGQDAADPAEFPASSHVARLGEIRPVDDAVKAAAELQPQVLGRRPALVHRRVHTNVTGSDAYVARRIAENSGSGPLERRSVEVLRQDLSARTVARDFEAVPQVGPLRRSVGVGGVALLEHSAGRAAAQFRDQPQPPSAGQVVQRRRWRSSVSPTQTVRLPSAPSSRRYCTGRKLEARW